MTETPDARTPAEQQRDVAVAALSDAADHLEAVSRKAEHWRAVVQNNEIAEARWSGIRNHARHQATRAHDALARIAEIGTAAPPIRPGHLVWTPDAPPSGWQPIETALKDGSAFIAYGRHDKDCPIQDGKDRYQEGDHWWAIGCWDVWRKPPLGQRFVFCKDGTPLDWGIPTHWMPLPEPPQEKGQ